MRSSPVKNALLWGLAFGLLEAAFFVRVNHVYPMGGGHLLLTFLFCIGYSLIALVAVAAYSLAAGRVPGSFPDLADIAPAWVFLLLLVVSRYMEVFSVNPRDVLGLFGAIVLTLLCAVLFFIAHRLAPRRLLAARRVLRLLVLALILLGSGLLVTAGPSIPPALPPRPTSVAVPEPQRDTGLRVLLIGLDGGTWTILDPLLEAGRLPTFSRLLAVGASADLRPFRPTLSPPLWTSIASGKKPAKHGIHSHVRTALPLGLPDIPDKTTRFESLSKTTKHSFRLVDRAFRFPLLSSTTEDVLASRLWEILDAAGFPTIVANWYVTYPASSTHGIVVSDLLRSTQAREEGIPGLVHPDSLTDALSLHAVPNADLLDERLFALLDVEDLDATGRSGLKTSFAEWFRTIGSGMASDLTNKTVARAAFEALPNWRFAAVYFRAMDNAHHMTWQWKDLPGDDLTTHPERRFRAAIDRYYEFCDTFLAEILPSLGEDTLVIVLSDHGFENARFGHARAPDGFFIMSGGPSRGGERTRIEVFDVAPTVLALLGMPVAEDMDGEVARELIRPAFWHRHPIRTIATYPKTDRFERLDVDRQLSPEEERQLKALGYLN